jgi:hypothetical protein
LKTTTTRSWRARAALLALLAAASLLIVLRRTRGADRGGETGDPSGTLSSRLPDDPRVAALVQAGRRLTHHTPPAFLSFRRTRPQLVTLNDVLAQNPPLMEAFRQAITDGREHDGEAINICAWELTRRDDRYRSTGVGGSLALTLVVSGGKGRVAGIESLDEEGPDAQFVDCLAGASSWAGAQWDLPSAPEGTWTVAWPYRFGPVAQ